MKPSDDEEKRLRSVAVQNAQNIPLSRQRAEEELVSAKEALELKSRELAHSLSVMHGTLESTKDGILISDENGNLTHFNRKYADMWQIPQAVMDSKKHRDVLAFIARQFADPEMFVAGVERIYTESPSESLDILELSNGRIFERFTKIQFVQGQKAGRVWSFRDITEQRRAEDALHDETRVLELLNRTGITLASKLDLQSLLQSITDSATQLSGAKFGAFFYNTVNDTGDTLMLYTLSGAPRDAFEKFGHPRATPLFGPTFKGGGPIRCDDVMTDPRYGKMAPHRGMPQGHLPVRSYLSVPVILRSGEVIGGLFFGHPEPGIFTERAERLVAGIASQSAVAIDNARLYEAAQQSAEERKRLLDSERSARAESERLSELKDEFLTTLSHELRTPLSSILGWAQVLRHGVRDQADLDKGLATIERNARMQTQLIEDLLDMSRITSGKVRLDIQTVEPIAFIEAALETVKPAADAKGIRVETLLDPAAGPISGDPGRLQQVAWNLLSNAIKFTPKGGKVQVVLQRVNSHIEINIADTGVGIPAGFVPHAFERFRQADASTTRRYGGLGIGLAIVKSLVELHGGTVQVKSAGEGQGSTFTVQLPLIAVVSDADCERRSHPRTPTAAVADFIMAELSGLKVLVVDDEADARDLLRRVLTDCNAIVFSAGTADEALLLVEREKPDVLISDIGMPNVDGFELLRRIRALGQARGGDVPAIAFTAFARSEDRTRALRAGFQTHVSKPVEPSELVATVASVAGRAAKLGPDDQIPGRE